MEDSKSPPQKNQGGQIMTFTQAIEVARAGKTVKMVGIHYHYLFVTMLPDITVWCTINKTKETMPAQLTVYMLDASWEEVEESITPD